MLCKKKNIWRIKMHIIKNYKRNSILRYLTQIILLKVSFIISWHLIFILYNYPSIAIYFSGNECNGIKAMAKYPGLVYYVLRGAVDCDDLYLHNFIGRKNSPTLGSYCNIYFIFRLHLLHSDFLVGNFKSFLCNCIRTRDYVSYFGVNHCKS